MWVMGTVGRGVGKSVGFLVGGEVPLEVTLEIRLEVPFGSSWEDNVTGHIRYKYSVERLPNRHKDYNHLSMVEGMLVEALTR